MTQSRRTFMATGLAAGAGIILLPFAARAAAEASDQFDTPAGPITVHPMAHASFVMESPKGTIYVDPVGDPVRYDRLPAADLILITHQHGDHYNAETLAALLRADTQIITNPAVLEQMPEALRARSRALANGEETQALGLPITAVPAYNLTEERKKFHPQGRDNGYVLRFEGFAVYVSGDTEDTPEMRGLEGIDLAFVCMNLPFTMDAAAAASAVSEFAPRYVYPYHYRGRDGGTQDPAEFAALLNSATEVRMGPWYD